jgi:ABC-type transport system involved in multi-copper enzyme maturation permease subunit
MTVAHIARNTFREAVRDRVLYNLILFALLMVGASVLFGQISVEIERIVVVNLGLTAMSIFGALIAIFIGIGLVSKEIEKRTLYTVLAHPVRRWEFILGKFFGLTGTLAVNTSFMAVGFFAAVMYVARGLGRGDMALVAAIYFIVLQLMMLVAIALLFSSFSSPILSAVMTFALFVIGSFGRDLHEFAAMAHGYVRWVATGVAYVVPNFAQLNVISAAAHGHAVTAAMLIQNTTYALAYCAAALAGAVMIFEHRNLK